MKNFIFISPNFPNHYFKFVEELKNVGFNVLGIGDCPYDNLSGELKSNLTEYYFCGDMDQNFDSLKNAVNYFKDKYGQIDYLESNNEYWLNRDAKLREIFDINGVKPKEIDVYQHKSLMKEKFQKAGVKTAKWVIYKSNEQLLDFIKEVGYPIFIKPNYGVGADGDYKIENSEDLQRFLTNHNPNIEYICEQFISGIIVSYDGIADNNSNVIFATDNIFPPSIADIANGGGELFYYCYPGVLSQLKNIGPKVIKSFEVKNRFFHIEFFIVTKAIKGFVDAGDIVALETNMRPAGGFTTDMINFANSIDCYKVFAEVLMNNSTSENFEREKFYCACASRRDSKEYLYPDEELLNKFEVICLGRYDDAVSAVMGNRFYMLRCKSLDEINMFKDFCNQAKHGPIMYTDAKNKHLTGEDIDMFNERKANKKKNESICDIHIDGA